MNVAGILAVAIAGQRDGGLASRGTEAAEQIAVDVELRPEVGVALEGFAAALARGEADELARLLTPVPIDEWIGRGEPGLLRLTVDEYAAMRARRHVVAIGDPLVHRLRSGPHLEARPLGDDVVIAPQHGGRDALSLALLVPSRSGAQVRMRRVEAPLDGDAWDSTAARVREAAAAQDHDAEEPAECEDALVEDDDGRWITGCMPQTCQGTCHVVGAGIERWVDLYGCVCRVEADRPEDDERA